MTLAGSQQSDFSAGAAPGNERISSRGVEDCVNGIYQDDATILKRGGCSYVSTADTDGDYGDLRAVWAGQAAQGERVIAASYGPWVDGGSTFHLAMLWELSGATGAFSALASGTLSNPTEGDYPGYNRPTGVGGLALFPRRQHSTVYVTNGDSTDAGYSHANITATQGSATVTGTGTAFVANVKAGAMMRMTVGSTDQFAVVQSVENNTSLTLTTAWRPATTTTTAYFGPTFTLFSPGGVTSPSSPSRVVSTAFDRLLIGFGRYLSFTPRGNPLYTDPTDYHEFPNGVFITGIEPLQDAVIVFTTDGVWAISGMALELTDDYGNIQHRVERINRDLVLWGDNGLASTPGGIVAPALDDIYILSLSGANKVSGGIRKLYRQYVTAGYVPGQAAVHRGHYFLPVLDPNADDEWVDTLVCNLTTGAWSRWDGYAGTCRAFYQRVRSGVPSLIGAAGAGPTDSRRIVSLTGCFEPSSSNKQDANASTFNLTVAFRALTAGTIPVLWNKFRVAYTHLDASSDNPTLTAQYAVNQESGFTDLYDGSDTSQTASAAESSDAIQWWNVRKRARSIRLRVTSTGPTSKLVIRGVETLYRPTGRR